MRVLLSAWFGLALAASSLGAPVVDQSHIVTQSTGGRIIYSGGSPAQVFTAGTAGLLSQIDVLLRRDAADIGDLSLEVWPVSTQGPAGATPLFSTPIDTATVPVGTADYVPVDVSAGAIGVAPGQQYAITVSGTSILGQDPYASWTSGHPDYTGGAKFDYDGSWRIGGTTSDYGFRTWVDPDLGGALEELVLTPVIDAEVQLYPTGVALTSYSGFSILIDQENQNGADSRGVFEFDASALPAGAEVVSADFSFDLTLLTSGSVGSPVVELYGFQGDGQAQVANAQDLSTLLGSSGPITEFETTTIPLNAAAVAGLTGGPGTVGVTAYQAVSNRNLAIAATEWGSSLIAPTLTIRYATDTGPEPAPLPVGDYNGDARVNAADYTVWRDASQTPGDLRADGDNDGDVDQQDYNLWRDHYGVAPDATVVNGDFETGDLSGWDLQVGANTDVRFGFPRVESFDVNGDGSSSDAMRLRLGRLDTDQFGGRFTIEQELLLEGGEYELSADVASQSLDSGGNTGPGNYELIFDGVVVDHVILNGTLIDSGEVIRNSLQALLTDVQPGYHTVGLAVARGATTFASIYHFVDNIALTPLAPGLAVPEPTALTLLAAASLALGRGRRRAI